MAKRSVQQEDPWAGFVDVLSNVVMVVTFIVIILGIAMFAMAQQVAEQIVRDLLQEEREIVEEAVGISRATSETASEGAFRVVAQRPTMVDDEIDGDVNLTIRRRDETLAIIDVAAMELDEASEGAVQIDSASSTITLNFDQDMYELDPTAVADAAEALTTAAATAADLVEVRAMAGSKIGSISEARRVAFYRAMRVRNILIQQGVQAAKIRVRVRESVAPEDGEKVFIFLNPEG